MLLPWYALQEGLDSGAWLAGLWSSEDYASGVAQVVEHGKWWLAPVLLALVACAALALLPVSRERRGTLLLAAAARDSSCSWPRRFGIGLRGWTAAWLTALFGELEAGRSASAPAPRSC